MLEKPALEDAAIILRLAHAYAVEADSLTFLPIGYDANSWVYSVDAKDGGRYFLKLRKGPINGASLSVPRFLHDAGMRSVVAPLPTDSGDLFARCEGFMLILYPYIHGTIAADIPRSKEQHVAAGRLLGELHATALPEKLLKQTPREPFVPKWSAIVRDIHRRFESGEAPGPVGTRLAHEWQQRAAEIMTIVDRTETLGRELKARKPQAVLCHADIHLHNQLVDESGGIHIVDWDEIILAPKERDLMFIVGDVDPKAQRAESETLFFAGYDEGRGESVAVEPLGIAYYRYEWVVQELGDCGQRIFSADNWGEQTKQAALQDFIELFEPGDVVEGAYSADIALQ